MTPRIILAATLALTPFMAHADGHAGMSFFLTSKGPGDGANLGGLNGADAHCTALAEAAGISGKTWAAYLSADGTNARDRIGAGPWVNYNGVTVATDVDNLHDAAANALSKENSISEMGAPINGRGDKPNRHDILTGSDAAGMSTGANCANWKSNGEGSATVGHHDRTGGGSDPTSWNAAHPSRGCSQANLQGTGGDGLFYCFAK
ncbi:hypothetical protein N9M66_03840 [Litoreibacter sp.]|nr:hypothetical protein [Litoreibacter sp.]